MQKKLKIFISGPITNEPNYKENFNKDSCVVRRRRIEKLCRPIQNVQPKGKKSVSDVKCFECVMKNIATKKHRVTNGHTVLFVVTLP